MFFIHNTQYSLLLLIQVQVQCDLAITRFTCVNVCSLNCLEIWNWLDLFCVCVCVCVCFEIKMLNFFLLRNIFESWKWCLDPWLSCMFNGIHIYVFLSLKNCFKATLTDPRHLLIPGLSFELFSCFLLQSQHLSIARWIDWESFCLLDSSSTDPRSIEILFALDTCLITSSIEPFKARHLSIYRELLSFYIKGPRVSALISLNLSWSI